jgi:hypothetical protein
VLCPRCWEHSNHQGHNWEIIQIVSGCCDCGDKSMWDQKGFCTLHAPDTPPEMDIETWETERYQELCSLFLSVLCCLYEALQDQAELVTECEDTRSPRLPEERETHAWILAKTDQYGSRFLGSLASLNKNQYGLNCITCDWLKKELGLPAGMFFLSSSSVLPEKQLLSFPELRETAEACFELYVRLCSSSSEFKRDITVHYFDLYGSNLLYADSSYVSFSAQLLVSSENIKKLL